MKLKSALNKLEKAGYEISSCHGSYVAEKGDVIISFYVNPGSDETSSFTYNSLTACAPTFGMNLKTAMSL